MKSVSRECVVDIVRSIMVRCLGLRISGINSIDSDDLGVASAQNREVSLWNPERKFVVLGRIQGKQVVLVSVVIVPAVAASHQG